MSDTSTIAAPSSASNAKTHNIKRSVSLYSFQEDYFLRKKTLEDCIAKAAELDVPGIEIIGDQMIRGYPNVPDSFFEQWHGWMEKYGRTPVCLDQFVDWNKYKGRVMSDDERAEVLIQDIKNASRLGCTVIRVIHDVSAAIMEKAAPYAEEYNVRLGNEIHAPSHLDDEFSRSLFEMMQRTGSKYVGFVIDLGIYTRRIPRVVSDRWVRDGMRQEIADYIIETYAATEGSGHRERPTTKGAGATLAEKWEERSKNEIVEGVTKMGGTEQEIGMARYAAHHIFADPRRMLEFMPWIFHFHAKFNEMLPDYTEYSIPYDEIIPVLIEGRYDGYLSSEYEGNRHLQDAFEVDADEQVRRHQVMLKRLLGEA